MVSEPKLQSKISFSMGDDKTKNNKTEININDPQSPYYLCAWGNLGNIICPVTFNGDNYANWSCLVINALKSKNKLMLPNQKLTPQKDMPESEAIQW